MKRSFNLEGTLRSDGRVRFTCDELPGFRLLLNSETDVSAYNSDITDALRAFVPLYFAAETRHNSIGIEHRERAKDGSRGQGIDLVASFASS